MKIVEQDGVKIYVPMTSEDAKILANMALSGDATTELPFHEETEIVEKGGAGSGHEGHAGRPGKQGGSLPGKGRHYSQIYDKLNSGLSKAENEIMCTEFHKVYGVELDDFLNNAYSYKDGKFVTSFTRLTYMNKDDTADGIPYIYVSANIDDMTGFEHSGLRRDAGDFARKIYLDKNIIGVDKKVEHSSFRIKPDYANQDLGVKMYEQSEKAYMEAGVDKIVLEADLAVGGYAWARMGFDFYDNIGRKDIVDKFTTLLRAQFDDGERIAQDFDDWENVHTWDIAAAIDKDGYRIGKNFMLNTHWLGVKYLDPYYEGYKVGQAYYAAHHK